MNVQMLHTARSVLTIIFIAFASLLSGAYAYSTWLEKPYLSYVNMPFPVMSKAEPGQRIAIQVARCSTSNVTEAYRTTHGIRNEVTHQNIILPSIEVTIKPGCLLEISKINVIPEEAKPGFYSFYGVAKVRGLMTTHDVPWNSETFEVLAKPKESTTKEPTTEVPTIEARVEADK